MSRWPLSEDLKEVREQPHECLGTCYDPENRVFPECSRNSRQASRKGRLGEVRGNQQSGLQHLQPFERILPLTRQEIGSPGKVLGRGVTGSVLHFQTLRGSEHFRTSLVELRVQSELREVHAGSHSVTETWGDCCVPLPHVCGWGLCDVFLITWEKSCKYYFFR